MKKRGYICLLLSVALLAYARGQERFRIDAPLGLDEYFYTPDDNLFTREKIELGRKLFFDRRLSSDGSLSCSSCHRPELAFSDGRRFPVGVGKRRGLRHAPAIINRAYGRSFFWDGRVSSLEEQVLDPIQNPNEMNLPLKVLVTRLKSDAEYGRQFKLEFSDGVTAANAAKALATFVRTIRSGDSPVDRFLNRDWGALSEAERRGLGLFRGKANCVTCHPGPNFTDEQFHNTGVSWGGDTGRYRVSRRVEDRGAFKTPTLREVSRTAPYMHDGSLATLKEVIEYYDRGANRNPHLDPELRPLQLTVEEKGWLLSFLRALKTQPRFESPETNK